MEKYSAIVVGVGPTGASAAIMLGQRGVQTLVLDRWPDVHPLPRAVHFDDEVFRVFATMDLGDDVRAITRPSPGMRLTDVNHRVLAEVYRDPTRQVHGYPHANMFDQPELERILRNALDKYPTVTFRGGVDVCEIEEVAGGPARVRVRYRTFDPATGAGVGDVHEVWADAVLGCDGANSMTRAVVGATMDDLNFQQQWLVVDVDTAHPLDVYDGVQQVCDSDRAATFMPVVPGRYRWEFRLRDGETPDDFDHARVLSLIEPWLKGMDLDEVTFLRQACYTFRGVVADTWRKGRIFLLGDAAHQTPPFIGQGLCAGIRDAANLAWKLALVLDGKADERILDTYEAERRPFARRIVRIAIIVGLAMTGGGLRANRPRNIAIRTASRLLGAEDRMVQSMWPAFAAGPLVADLGRRGATGEVLSQPRVDGVLLDELIGPGWAIVYRGPDLVTAFDPDTRGYFEALGTTVIRDEGGQLEPLFAAAKADAVLLRPDRVAAAAGDTPDLRSWQRTLQAAGIW
jgi:3-(3-hydroxy-phenyl)propionate hydroxylase